MADVYARRLDVVNRGLSGYNTDWGLRVLRQVCHLYWPPPFHSTLPKCLVRRKNEHTPKIRVITIWFGANDACLKPSPQHVPKDTFVDNLRQMISIIRAADPSRETRIILLTPPPVNTYQRGAALAARNPPLACDRKFSTTREYAEAVLAVAAIEHLVVVDIWSAMYEAAEKDEQKLSKFLVDGLHPNEAGYSVRGIVGYLCFCS
jgi:lysophospholipase L1-like esterase